MDKMKPYDRSVWAAYIKLALLESECPRSNPLYTSAKLEFLFRQYGRTFKTKQDWVGVA